MKKDFKDRLASCIKDLTGAEIKGITIDEESGAVSVVLVPGRGHGRVSLSQLPDVLKVADVDIVGGDITLLGSYAGVRASAASSPSSVGKPAARSTTWSSAPANCSTN